MLVAVRKTNLPHGCAVHIYFAVVEWFAVGGTQLDFWLEIFKPPMSCQRLSLQLDASCKTLSDQEIWNTYHDLVHQRTKAILLLSKMLRSHGRNFLAYKYAPC